MKKKKKIQQKFFSIDQSLFVGDRAGLKKQRREKREVTISQAGYILDNLHLGDEDG